jgi:hypothetical protein
MEASGQLYGGGKSHRYPLDRRLGGPKGLRGCESEEKDVCRPVFEMFIDLQLPELRSSRRSTNSLHSHDITNQLDETRS